MSDGVLAAVQAVHEDMVRWRRFIHQHPELGFAEVGTAALVKRELEACGVEIRPINLESGVLGVLRGRGEGKVVALRADMDALPMQEETGLSYASQHEGIMHACGHDGHTAVLLGVAKVLSAMRDAWEGEVRFIFQPAEETLYGAKRMIEAGALVDPPVDMVVGLHASPLIEVGQIGIRQGPVMAAADMFTATFIGDGGHGAYPHRTQDPVLTASQAVVALQGIVSRRINALDSAVISVCWITGGTAFNIIPREVTIKGTVRTLNEAVRAQMPSYLRQTIKGVCEAFGCQYQFEYTKGVPSVQNDPQLVAAVRAAAAKVLGSENVVSIAEPLLGSEDFAFYVEQVPASAFFQLGYAKPGETPHNIHNSHFDFDDDTLVPGAASFVQLVLDVAGTRSGPGPDLAPI